MNLTRCKQFVLDYVVPFAALSLGAIIAAFALEEFLVPATILDGGITGWIFFYDCN